MAARYILDRHSFVDHIVTRVVSHFLDRSDRLSSIADSTAEVNAEAANYVLHVIIPENYPNASHHLQSILHTIVSDNLTSILHQTIDKRKQDAEVFDARFQIFKIPPHTNTNPNHKMHATCLFR